MHKILMASVALSVLTLGAAQAQEAKPGDTMPDRSTTQSTTGEGPGAPLGAAAGAATGAVVGGPVGAVIGGVAGLIVGKATSVPQPAVDYVVANPVEPVAVEGEIAEGMAIPEGATLTPIPDQPEFAYVYVDGRPVIVRMESREVVYSPGYVVPDQTVAYVEANPVDPVVLEAVEVGSTVPADVALVEVPNDPAYAYVYTDAGPVLVNTSSRTVVWFEGG